MPNQTLYLCYFGLREPLVQTQVLPYLGEIKKLENIKVGLLTFEPDFKKNWTAEQIETEQKRLAAQGINWYCLPYHKRPSALVTLYDILNGVRFVINLSRKEKIDILHARAHIPMLMAMLISKVTKSKILFDIRGLMADEYADAGVWQENSKIFRFIKQIERWGIKEASEIVVLTNRMRNYLVGNHLKLRKNIEVIPCCFDFSRVEQNTGIEKKPRFEMIYAGSVTGLYLLHEMGSFFLELKRLKSDAFFQILTASPPEVIQEAFDKLGIDKDDYAVSRVLPSEVPKHLKRAHLGISFRMATFSQMASSPTKIPEYLACGLPVVLNYGIGDVDYLLEKEKVGICLKSFDAEEMVKATGEIFDILSEDKIAERCIKVAHEYFDLDNVGGKRYQNVYRRLMN